MREERPPKHFTTRPPSCHAHTPHATIPTPHSHPHPPSQSAIISIIRSHDILNRPISSGHSLPRTSAYHLMQSFPLKEDWTLDTIEQVTCAAVWLTCWLTCLCGTRARVCGCT